MNPTREQLRDAVIRDAWERFEDACEAARMECRRAIEAAEGRRQREIDLAKAHFDAMDERGES